LYRTVLSLAVAAIVAAWLPFSVLYISAQSNRAAVSAISAPAAGRQAAGTVAPVTTRVSGGVAVSAAQPATATAARPGPTATFITTHTS
jgi:hypothetical protein